MDVDSNMCVSTVVLPAKPSGTCLIGLALRQAVRLGLRKDTLYSNVTYYATVYHGSLKVLRHIESLPIDTFGAQQYHIAEERTPRTIRLNR